MCDLDVSEIDTENLMASLSFLTMLTSEEVCIWMGQFSMHPMKEPQ
jgi:hypothetical protein